MLTQLLQCLLCLALNFMLFVTDGHNLRKQIVDDNFFHFSGTKLHYMYL